MARVKSFSLEQVKALAGTIDFYYWKGIPVARKWPDWSRFKPSPAQAASMEAFATIRADVKRISPTIRDLWRAACVGRTNAWVDLFTFLWFQYWRQGVSPAPVLLDVSKQVQGNNLVLSFSFSAPPSSHLVIGDGFYKGVRRTTESKGRREHCWDPPIPIPPVSPIPPVPIVSPPSGQVQVEMWDMGLGCRSSGYWASWGSCEDAKNIARQKYDSYSCHSLWSSFLARIEAICFYHHMEGYPDYWIASYDSYASDRIVMLWAWYDQHPGMDPDVLIFEDDPGAWDIVGPAYPGLCGYPGDGPCAVSENAPSVKFSPGGSGVYSLPFDSAFLDPWWGGLSVRWRISQLPYVFNPSCSPPSYGEYLHNYYSGPARCYAAFQSAGYRASIPLSSLSGLSRPVAFVVSHDLPAVAPPIPLS